MDEKLKTLYLGLVEKYNIKGSFYTDYPPLGLWPKEFSDKEYKGALTELISAKDRSFSLYIHFPFCPKICYYCQCYSIIERSRSKIEEFLEYLFKEIDLLKEFFDDRNFNPNIREIHLGGGSPSYMNKKEFDMLEKKLSFLVDIKNLDEFAIEIDPRTVNREKMIYYHEKRITRISFGIQDFDPRVQKAVNRIQPVEMIEELISPDIRKYSKGVNFDIIYGMPLQTKESMRKTVETIKRLAPDRIAFSIMGWRPDIFKHQRLIKESDIPSCVESAEINFESVQSLLEAGYEQIGIDYFSKPEDDLAKAKRNRTLYRNENGYTPGRCNDIIGFGPSSTSRILDHYFQKKYGLEEFYSDIQSKKFPILRGYKMSRDDELRREIMYEIICYSHVGFDEINQKYGVDFRNYFRDEISSLDELRRDGIVEVSDNEINVTPIGKFFLRHVCRAFDGFLKRGEEYKHSRDTA